MTTITVPSSGDPITAAWGASVANLLNANTARTSSSGSITTSQTQVIGLTVPANALVAGSTYRLEGWGVCTSSAANVVTFRVRVGTTTLTGNIAGSRAPTATTTASSDGFKVEALFTVRTAGASGTCVAQVAHLGQSAQPFSAPTTVSPTNSTVTVDTTVQNILELTAVTAAGTTSVTFYGAAIHVVA